MTGRSFRTGRGCGVLLALLLAGCGGRVPPAVEPEVRRALDAHFSRLVARPQPFASVTLSPIPGHPEWLAANGEWETSWWGAFACVRLRDGRVEEVVSLPYESPQAPSEQSLFRVRGVRLEGFRNPMVEVIGQTHMGHGNFHLYELDGGSLRLLVTTFVLDRHRDRTLIEPPHLRVEYADLDGDGTDDLTFTGVILEWDAAAPDDAPPDRRTACTKVFLWDRLRREYREDPARRLGFERYPGRP